MRCGLSYLPDSAPRAKSAARYFADAIGWKVSRGIEPSRSSAGFKLSHLGGHGATSCWRDMNSNAEGAT